MRLRFVLGELLDAGGRLASTSAAGYLVAYKPRLGFGGRRHLAILP
jgi:hypothetical protein